MRGAMLPRLWLGGVLMLFSVAVMAENAVTTDVASVRAGPDDSYPEVAQLDPDSPVQVMGCLDDWSWCDVAFGDNRGWLYAPDISYEYEGGYVPFYTYAPAFGLPVLTFSLDTYWGSHYRSRPWYGQRDEWIHRTFHHERPPGPAPSHTRPPREVVSAERPHGRSRPGEPAVRLSEAERGHRDQERAGRAPDVGRSPERRASPETRPQERALPTPEHSAPLEHTVPSQHFAPPEHTARPERSAPSEHTAPPAQEQRQRAEREPRAQDRGAAPREQEHPHSAERPSRPEEHHDAPAKPEAAPRKDENDHRG